MDNRTGNAAFGDRLREVRKRNGLSQVRFGKLLGNKSHAQTCRMENGRALPATKTLAKLAKVVDVDLHWLITGELSPTVIAEKQASGALQIRVKAVILEACPEFYSLLKVVAAFESTDEQGGMNGTEK